MKKLPWASQSVVANAYLWSEWFNKSHSFCLIDQNTLTICYEDLVLEPERILRRVCTHVGREFEFSMLDRSKSADSVASPKEQWKLQVSQAVRLKPTICLEKNSA